MPHSSPRNARNVVHVSKLDKPSARPVARARPKGWRPYVYRDPARVTPRRAAELRAMDEEHRGDGSRS